MGEPNITPDASGLLTYLRFQNLTTSSAKKHGSGSSDWRLKVVPAGNLKRTNSEPLATSPFQHKFPREAFTPPGSLHRNPTAIRHWRTRCVVCEMKTYVCRSNAPSWRRQKEWKKMYGMFCRKVGLLGVGIKGWWCLWQCRYIQGYLVGCCVNRKRASSQTPEEWQPNGWGTHIASHKHLGMWIPTALLIDEQVEKVHVFFGTLGSTQEVRCWWLYIYI